MSDRVDTNALEHFSDVDLWRRANDLHGAGQIVAVRAVQIELENRVFAEMFGPMRDADRRSRLADCIVTIDEWYLLEDSDYGTRKWREQRPSPIPRRDPAETRHFHAVIQSLASS